MKITTHPESLAGEPMDSAHFTGRATGHPLFVNTEPQPIRVSVVRFDAGTRNHWHRHVGGQVLHVIEGEGLVQTRGQEARRIGVGDSASADPGEEHWHGAGPDGPMAHIAISLGETLWSEAQ